MDTKHISSHEIITFIGKDVLNHYGSKSVNVTGFSYLGNHSKNVLLFVKNTSLLRDAQLPQNSIIIIPEIDSTTLSKDLLENNLFISVHDPRLCFIKCLNKFFAPQKPVGIHPTAVIDETAQIDPSCYIGAYSVIGANCIIEAGSCIYPHVCLYDGVKIGQNVIIHANTVIGADGFGYQRDDKGHFEKFPHYGHVIIEDNVEIGSNTSIDRGTLGDTIIRENAKIDNLVHIAHNVYIGEETAVIAQSIIGGSAKIGARSWIAPAAAVMNGIELGQDSFVGMSATVTKNVAQGDVVVGSPARPIKIYQKMMRALKQLAESDG